MIQITKDFVNDLQDDLNLLFKKSNVRGGNTISSV